MRKIASALKRAQADETHEVERWDVFAYLSFCLEAMNQTIEQTTIAWEKRGYWVKADRFRQDWSWVEQAFQALDSALSEEDENKAIEAAAALIPELTGIQPYKNSGKQQPWRGSFKAWSQQH